MKGQPEEIKALRNVRGLTQQDLATALGVSVTTISRWENGQHRPSRMACKALNHLARQDIAPNS